ncbi:MAG: hypothetical protein HKN43_01340, partial [Rhodothermales bacterium]|nr:hypothetical protein [Rhodothermales bacterium]
MTLVVAPHARLAAAQGVNQIHPGFVALDTLDASIVHDIAYYGTDNFIGTPIDGYERSACLLTVEAADALVRANDELRDFGLAIKVFDCYRPQTAVNHFVRWAQQKDDTAMKDRYYP